MDSTVATPSDSVRIKFRDKISENPLKNVSDFDMILYEFTHSNSFSDHEITIYSPRGEDIRFIFDTSTFRSILKDNCVVLSQYGVDVFEIYPTIDSEFYMIDIKKCGNLYMQYYN
jgi:hypothetical protein